MFYARNGESTCTLAIASALRVSQSHDIGVVKPRAE